MRTAEEIALAERLDRDMADSLKKMSRPACAHLRVRWASEPCDAPNVRGEMVPGLGTRGWWECESCKVHFAPLPLSAHVLQKSLLRIREAIDGELTEVAEKSR